MGIKLIIVFCFTLISSLIWPFHATVSASLATNCETERCLRQLIFKSPSASIKSSVCKVYDGRKSKSIFKSDMGVICRLQIARRKAGTRKVRPCHDDGSMSPDWNIELSSWPLWFHARAIYAQTPKALRALARLEKSGYNNSTIYDTYVLGLTKSIFYRDVKKPSQRFRFDVYFCQTVDGVHPKFYQPYFYVISKEQKSKGAKDWSLIGKKMAYIDKPPLARVKVLRQMPRSVKSDFKTFELVDFNQDGKKDVIFIEELGHNQYRPGVCLYAKGKASCKKIVADTTIKSKIFFQKVGMTWKINKQITIIVREESANKKPDERYLYRYRNGHFQRVGK